MSGPGDFQSLNEGDGNSKNWFEQAAGRGSSLVGAGQDLADASSPPEWGVASVSARAELLTSMASPGQALMSNGLGFLVSIVLSPLIELAEYAVGDPEQMRATGEGWEKVATWLDGVSEQEKNRAQATAETWVGKDGDAFRQQMTEFGDGVTALAQDVRDLKGTLDMIADIFDMFVEFFIQVVTELIIGLIVQWLAALAASWITAGASVGAASAGTAAQVGVQGGRISARIAQVQGKLFQLFQKLEQLLVRLRGPLKSVLDRVNNIPGGQMLTNRLGRQNPVFGVAKQFDANTLASTTNNVFMKGVTGEGALAANVSQRVIGGVLGGQTSVGRAAMSAGMEVGTDAAIEQGANHAYDTGKGWFQGDLSEDDRRAAQEKGFS
ncbi:hypothetical protein LZ318_40150 [Saccharopolyspora indica]|uniref:WXG100 family type VII secretion target n=1 Tax=Saccharopolyspora indica TaxID=1229659 RepID=UPI0022EB45AA|nr:hypothetical protein [Saccharopolyspora indica]MDA3650177.1 hypothetical protein [Saccharopolyspora indica]